MAPANTTAPTSTSKILSSVQLDLPPIPSALEDVLPSCAQTCVSLYIEQSFLPGICHSTSDLGCLCTHYSKAGYTIGEASLACLDSNCPDADTGQESEAYHICAGVSAAVTATHSTLTLMSLPTTAMQTSTPIPSTNSTVSASLTSMTTAATSLSSPSTLPTTPSTLSPPPYATSNNTASTSSTLTSAQAAGVSIGAFGGMALLAGLIFCCVCCRRRKARKKPPPPPSKARKHSYDFVDAETPRFSPFKHGQDDPRGPMGGFAYRRVELPGEEKRSGPPQYKIEPAHNHSRTVSAESGAVSVKSERTVSQLLPDKPPSGHHPAFMPHVRAVSPPDDAEGSMPRAANFVQFPVKPDPTRTAPTKPDFCDVYTKSPDEVRPNLFLRIPSQKMKRARKPVPLSKDKPPEHHNPLRANPLDNRVSAPLNSGMSYLPSYYLSDASRTPKIRSPPAADRSHRTPPRPARPPPPKRLASLRRTSQASDTTFESTDPDDETPPEELDKQLTPLQESPLSGLRYPKVPRSANQAVPRSPPPSRPKFNHQHPVDVSTLLPPAGMKSTWDRVAEGVQRRDGEASKRDSAMARWTVWPSGHAEPISPPKQTSVSPESIKTTSPTDGLRSPDFFRRDGPELTPSKRGNDLMISVAMF